MGPCRAGVGAGSARIRFGLSMPLTWMRICWRQVAPSVAAQWSCEPFDASLSGQAGAR
jgi:hypothetical protein